MNQHQKRKPGAGNAGHFVNRRETGKSHPDLEPVTKPADQNAIETLHPWLKQLLELKAAGVAESQARAWYDDQSFALALYQYDKALEAWTLTAAVYQVQNPADLQGISDTLTAAFDQARECDYQKRLRRAGIPLANQDATFKNDTSQRKQLVDNAIAWVDQFQPGNSRLDKETLQMRYDAASCSGLLLIGPVGCGKTLMAACIAREIMHLGCSVRWYQAADLFTRLRKSYKSSSDSESDILQNWSDAALVVLDDLGSENLNDWQQARLVQLLNARLDNLQPLLITTNLSMDEMDKALGSRAASRLHMVPSLGHFPQQDFRRSGGQP